jgi:hypothetical protein
MRKERGAALVLVVVALAVLLPLVLVLSRNVVARQNRTTAFRETVRREMILRDAFGRTAERLRRERFDLAPDEGRRLRFIGLDPTIEVEITRQPDAVIGLDGRVFRGREASSLDLELAGLDPREIMVHQYRKLQIYLVEAESRGGGFVPAVRLLGVLARRWDGRVVSLGVRVDRIPS